MADLMVLRDVRTVRVRIPGFDVDLTFVRTPDDVFYVPVKQACAALGINYTTQRDVLLDAEASQYRREGALASTRIETPGGMQEVLAIRKREFAWWLAHVNPKRVKEGLRERIEEFQFAVMAEADRLLFGDVSHSIDAQRALRLLHQPSGSLHFRCLMCGKPHRFVVRDGQNYVEIDQEAE